MDYTTMIWSAVVCIENHLRDEEIYSSLEHQTGYSITHIRDIFKKCMGIPLSKYILERKINHCAFELLHSQKPALGIANDYGISNADTFTRAFRRITNMNPTCFRMEKPIVGMSKLCGSIYGLEILKNKERTVMNEKLYDNPHNTILLGIPKVEYGPKGCTPFPICLTTCAQFLGQQIEHYYTMAACGAAFRLTWDKTAWNGGNVDVLHTFDNSEQIFRNGISFIGRDFKIINRSNKVTKNDPEKFGGFNSDASKEEFKAFIREEIGKGHPCIALGIIGPAEACIISGYQDDGDTLLGWNFFQDMPEYSSSISFEDNGYFNTKAWWENEDTIAVMSIGEGYINPLPDRTREIINNAITVLEGRVYRKYAKGLAAYDAWKKMLLDENEFPKGILMADKMNRLMCHNDAVTSLLDGRNNAAAYMKSVASKYQVQAELCNEIAGYFKQITKTIWQMTTLLDGLSIDETAVEKFYTRGTRENICKLIDKAKETDDKALQGLMKLAGLL